MTMTASQASTPNVLVKLSSSFCSGDFDRLVALTMSAMWPIWVAWPVAVTTNDADPRVTWVFWNSMLIRSPNAVSGATTVTASLATGALSPVRAASWTSRVADVNTRPSAGTRSPASMSTTSPGTTDAAATSATRPSRRTRGRRGHLQLQASASALARAFFSWVVPITTLKVTRTATMTPVATWSMTKLAMATRINMMFIGFAS